MCEYKAVLEQTGDSILSAHIWLCVWEILNWHNAGLYRDNNSVEQMALSLVIY